MFCMEDKVLNIYSAFHVADFAFARTQIARHWNEMRSIHMEMQIKDNFAVISQFYPGIKLFGYNFTVSDLNMFRAHMLHSWLDHYIAKI